MAPPTRVVTLSHATGAEGEGIGRIVAERLGFRYIDQEIIDLAAERVGVDAALVADVERRKSLLARILSVFGQGPVTEAAGASGVLVPDAIKAADSDGLRALIVDAIKETAERGDVVIVSHAASIPLAGRKDLLRVLVTASVATRERRVTEAARGAKVDAATIVKDSDAGRADYFVQFYEIERELPTHYDLVINTDVLTPAEAAELVIAAARRSS
jgi:cytidylate kinase